ncbi:hypothetical protein [Enterovirga sp.]|jgi:hypothetical protein|uniref:hypothetical protein n=1 Tax=Enterovirga sp. TaxID=2026350 RepID=UPI0026362CC8|nr:hypothetical protein [Enterovirga sp.]MDB5590406.1 hypothetical protein [Enterovirga sp.]
MTRFPAGTSLTAAARQERARKMAQDGDAARAEQKAQSEATDAKTERLRALRLERDRVETEALAAAALLKPAKASTKKPAKVTPKVTRRSIPVG